MEFGDRKSIPKPANCTHPTLRNVVIWTKVLPRHYNDETFTYDVYNFRNKRTKEWLTVCLGNYREGRIDCAFLRKGRTLAWIEDVDNMEPLP